MKKIVFSSFISILCLVVLSFLCSLIFSIVQYNNGIQIKPYIMTICSVFIFFISGCIFGLINKKQGLLGSLIFVLVYLLFILIFDVILKVNSTNKYYFLFVILKIISYMSGSVLMVNIKTK